jgi:hypothetical protein
MSTFADTFEDRAHYVTEQSASMDPVVYVITDHGRRALAS